MGVTASAVVVGVDGPDTGTALSESLSGDPEVPSFSSWLAQLWRSDGVL